MSSQKQTSVLRMKPDKFNRSYNGKVLTRGVFQKTLCSEAGPGVYKRKSVQESMAENLWKVSPELNLLRYLL